MDNIYTQIANVGFPITMATYLLVRIEGKLTVLTESINNLAHEIEKMKR